MKMENKKFRLYYLFCSIGVFLASFYPLYMGVRVISDMLSDGTVLKENYPKYIIPYTPISIAIIFGVLLMPLLFRVMKRFALLGGTVISTIIFFAAELLFERKVVVTSSEAIAKLEDWQMYMCYVPPEGYASYKEQTPVDILIGNYNPAFKLHFYVISVVLILSVLSILYGFAAMIKSGDNKRKDSLILQSVSTASFLGLCILACFTAFWRNGELKVSALSAFLMIVFFILLGVTVGIYIGSFCIGKRKTISVVLPAIIASAMTLLMYAGEMILLHGNLYRFGEGCFFVSLPVVVLAPVDVIVILASGCLTALIFRIMRKKSE